MENRFLILIVLLGLVGLGIHPQADRATWAMENAPVIIILPLVVYFQPRFKFSQWTLRFMVLHAFVLMFGGYYTYAKVPFGFWLQDIFGFARNPYDRIGHFFQGFVPALVFLEMILRKALLPQGKFLTLVVVSFCLAFSAIYELLEWSAALIMGQGADDFLGTQGDVWDTQWDMFMALVGAITALIIIRPLLARFSKQSNERP